MKECKETGGHCAQYTNSMTIILLICNVLTLLYAI